MQHKLNKAKNNVKRGFTIVELLIVIVVIAILAAISIVVYNGIQARSQDAKRAQDLATIEKAILGYEAINSGVPQTCAYSGNPCGVWNNSTHTNWLTFLDKDFGKMPRDVVNRLSGDAMPDSPGERAYYYYCYPASTTGGWPARPTARFGYRSEKTDNTVQRELIVQECLATAP